MQVTELRCNDKIDPLGLDDRTPRLTWRLDADDPNRRGLRQTGYRIQVGSSQGANDLWDTGKVTSDQSLRIPYDGATLSSGQRVYWQATVWDETGTPATSNSAFWEMGLLLLEDWHGAEWIGAFLTGGTRTTIPVPCLRRAFTVGPNVTSARLYVTALGLYEAALNGKRVGDEWLAPGWTNYRKAVHYQTYDVRDLLQAGENTLDAWLGDGWYCGHVGGGGRQEYGHRPRLLACLVIREGEEETAIVSDGDWQHAFGPLLESDMMQGESCDARRELSDWQPVCVFPDNGAERTASPAPPIRITEEVAPVGEPRVVPGWPQPDYIFDFGQNLVGTVRLKVKGVAGTTIRLRYAEVLQGGPHATDGPIYTTNLRSARCTDYYTLRGDEQGETWIPKFTFHGFRYVEVHIFSVQHPTTSAGAADALTLTRDTLTALVQHSDIPKTGDFTCSDPLLNQLQKNIDWGQRGNFLDVPTDCPQRDERLGWTGDAQVFIRTAAFNRDVAGFFRKWQRDLDHAQRESGSIPSVVPNTDETGGGDGGPAWADAVIICPWTIYQCYGDTKILNDHYSSFTRFLDFLATTAKDHIRCYEGYTGWRGFGDWLNIDADTPQDLIGTAFYAYDAALLSRIASVLGKDEDARTYRQLFERIRQAFQARYLTPDGLIVSGTQTAMVLALHFDLVPDDLRQAVAHNLVLNIKKRGNRLSTGFVGSPYLNHVLTELGHLDTAYTLLHQTRWPSWLHAVTQGATTIWERWDGWTHDKGFQDAGMNSFNHYAYGAIGAWLYQSVTGIDLDPAAPGYQKIVLRPRPGGNLTHARATYQSGYGEIVSGWEKTDAGLTWQVTVPPNTTATAYVPSAPGDTITESGQNTANAPSVRFLRRDEGQTPASVYELAPGQYRFTAESQVP